MKKTNKKDTERVIISISEETNSPSPFVQGIFPDANKSTELGLETESGVSRRQILKGISSAPMLYVGSTNLSFAFEFDAQGNIVLFDRNPLGFTGQYQHLKTGLYPLGNGYRSYSPSLKRFLQYDRQQSPFNEGGINGYCYGMNNPTQYYDPNGRFIVLISSLISAAIAIAKIAVKLAVVILATEAVRLVTFKIAKSFGASEKVAGHIGESLSFAIGLIFGASAISGSVQAFKTVTSMAVKVTQITGAIGSSLYIGSQTLNYAAGFLDDKNFHKKRLQIAGTAFGTASAIIGLVSTVGGIVSQSSLGITTRQTTHFGKEVRTTKAYTYTFSNTMKPKEVVNAVGGIIGTANTVVGTVGFATNNDKIKMVTGFIGLGVSAMKFGANSASINTLDSKSKDIPAMMREFTRASLAGSDMEKLANTHFTPFFNYDYL